MHFVFIWSFGKVSLLRFLQILEKWRKIVFRKGVPAIWQRHLWYLHYSLNILITFDRIVSLDNLWFMIAITRIMQRSRHFWSNVSKWKTWNTDERNPWKKNAKNHQRPIHSWRLLGIALFQAWNDLRNCQRSFTSSSMLCSTATSLALSTDLSCSRSWITFLMPLLKGIQIHMVKSKYGILKMILCMFSWEIEYQNRISLLHSRF